MRIVKLILITVALSYLPGLQSQPGLTFNGSAYNYSNLVAKLSSEKPKYNSMNDAKLRVVIKNVGLKDRIINPFILSSPVLSVEVLDSKGEVMSTVPPRVPPRNWEEYDKVIKPDEEFVFMYHMDIFHPEELPKGEYKIRMKGMKSNLLKIKIGDYTDGPS